LRDEIRRLEQLELATAPDALSGEAGTDRAGPGRKRAAEPSGTRDGRVRQGGEGGRRGPRKNTLDEMTVRRTETPLPSRARKPELDEMGGSGDHGVPVGPEDFTRPT